MSLRIAARIARRELRGGLRGFRVFLACLALGVAAIAAVGSVRASIEAGLAREGAALLGGDAAITLTYRFATPDERAWMETRAEAVSEIAEFRSMVSAGEGADEDRALTQVKAVDDAYPLYGALVLDPPIPPETAFAGENGVPGAVLDRMLIDRLELTPGDPIRIGGQDFVLMAALLREPDSNTAGFELGPRSLVHRAALDATGILRPGTLFDSSYRLQLAPQTDLDTLRAAARDAVGDGLRWRDQRNGTPGVSEFVERLGAFLVLVGLAGLAVGGVGVSAAVRAYLDGKTAVIATLKTLGAERRTIFWVYFLQIGALTALGLLIGLTLGALVPVAAGPALAEMLPVPAAIGIYPAPLAEAALYGALAAAIFTLWPLARAQDSRAAALYRDARIGVHGWPRPVWIALNLALVAVLVAAAAVLTGVPVLAFGAAVGILGAFVILVLAALLVRRMARWLAHRSALRGRTITRLALGSVGGPGGETMAVMLSLGLGLSVLAAVGQIDHNLRGAIARDLPDAAPSYFVVDIQSDQIADLIARLDDAPAVSTYETAPMLRGVVTEINGRPAREVAGGHWVVQGDRGLTYSAAQPDNARLTQGEWWPADYDGPPQISFGASEAAELGLVLGDMITLNVMGRDITGTITSFREVDFSTAGMGFVMSMNPAALAGAPHSHIATIYADEAAEAAIGRDLARAFPNITLIHMREAIGRVAELLGSIAAATSVGAGATLITGAIVLIGAAAAGELARRYEAAILKTLGASRAEILASFALRAALVGVFAGIVAIAAGALAGWAIMRFVMDVPFQFEPVSAIAIVAGGVIVTMLSGLWFTLRALRVRPAQMLRARD